MLGGACKRAAETPLRGAAKVSPARQRAKSLINTRCRVNAAIPRVRDFRGVPTRSFDGRGNYTLGVKEQIIFPEIDYDKVDKVRGLDITITTNAGTDDEARALLAAFNFPFRK